MGLKPSGYIMGILVFTFFILSGITMMGELRQSKSSFASEEEFGSFNSTFNVYADVSQSVTGIQGNIEDADPDPERFGALNSLIQTSWNTIRLLFSGFVFMNAVFLGMSGPPFNVPAFVPGLIILGVSVMFAFAIFGAIFQREL